jgi:hypothetical protein
MDFLTTNFPQDISSKHNGSFRLLDLPLEILFKVLIFLDVPDLINLSKTCQYLKQVSNERFIMRCRLLLIRERLNHQLMMRPDSGTLYEQHILPSKDLGVNPEVLTTAAVLEKNLRRDSLSKKLRMRPSLEELKAQRIIKKPEGVVDEIKTRLQNQELSQMLQLLLKSWRFQKKIVKNDVEVLAQSGLDQEYLEVYGKVLNTKVTPRKKSILSSDDVPTRANSSKTSEHIVTPSGYASTDSECNISPIMSPVMSRQSSQGEESLRVNSAGFNDDMTRPRQNHRDEFSDAASNESNEVITSTDNDTNEVNETYDIKSLCESSNSSPTVLSNDMISPKRSVSLYNPLCDKLHSVRTKKEYFEELVSKNKEEANRSFSTSDKVLNHIEVGSKDRPRNRPSRTVLKALVNDNLIRYEKLF